MPNEKRTTIWVDPYVYVQYQFDLFLRLWHHLGKMTETRNQFFLIRAASKPAAERKNNFQSVTS